MVPLAHDAATSVTSIPCLRPAWRISAVQDGYLKHSRNVYSTSFTNPLAVSSPSTSANSMMIWDDGPNDASCKDKWLKRKEAIRDKYYSLTWSITNCGASDPVVVYSNLFFSINATSSAISWGTALFYATKSSEIQVEILLSRFCLKSLVVIKFCLPSYTWL